MSVKMIRNESSSHFLGLKKMIKQKMEEVFITKTKKTYGISKENTGPAMKKHPQNFLLN